MINKFLSGVLSILQEDLAATDAAGGTENTESESIVAKDGMCNEICSALL